MNNARIWLVVKPSVGIPLMLIGVVVASLLVHFSILINTTWFAKFLEGGKKPAGASAIQPQDVQPVTVGSAPTVNVEGVRAALARGVG